MDPLPPRTIADCELDRPGGCALTAGIGAYHDGELDESAVQEVEAHIAACPDCQVELAALRELSDMAHQLGAEGLAPSRLGQIHRLVDAEGQAHSIFRLAVGLSGLAASALIVGGIWLVELGGRTPPPPSPISIDRTEPWENIAMRGPDSESAPSFGEATVRLWRPSKARLVDWMLQGLKGAGR